MTEKDPRRGAENTIREILKLAGGAKPAFDDAGDYFRSLGELDYASALRRQFDRQQMLEILAELRIMLPTLNRETFRTKDPRRLAKIAGDLGVILQASSFEGPVGRSLRGFYVDDRELLKRPLIWVNTATHPVGVAATFWHEIGHHLTRRIFGGLHQQTNLSFNANYQDHLDDPREIAADMLLALAGYPKPAAKRLFGVSKGDAPNEGADPSIGKALEYLGSVAGFRFESRISATENLHYLAGIIHVAKLRAVLLAEYGI